MPKTLFQKGNSGGRKARDFSVKTLTVIEAQALLQTHVKPLTEEQVDEGVKPILSRSFRAVRCDFNARQKKLILGIYLAIEQGFDQMNLGVICRSIGVDKRVWYQMMHQNNAEAVQALRAWVEGLLRDADLAKLGAIKASLADQAAKGSVKHQELYLKVNGYLKPDQVAAPGGVTFQVFRELPKEAMPEAPLDVQALSHQPPQMGTMDADKVAELLPVLNEVEPVPEEKKPTRRDTHGGRYDRPNHFEGEPLI